MNLTQRLLTKAPKLSIGDGAMGFWNALGKSGQPLISSVVECIKRLMSWKSNLKSKMPYINIWQAETRDEAYKAFDNCIERF